MRFLAPLVGFRENLKLDGEVWSEIYTQEDNNGIHYVLGRNYDQRTRRSLRSSFTKQIQCWVGFHCNEPLGRQRVHITVDAVEIDPETKKNKSGADAFRRKVRSRWILSYPVTTDSN